jgi:PAS domain S-box-containing protein
VDGKDNNEAGLLRSVALQNAQAILQTRQRTEEALRKQTEWLRVILASIGDAVISTDAEGRITFVNGVAEALTGWPQAEAVGRPLTDVFRIVNERTRQPVENPALRALREGTVVGLANHTVLIARDGTERPIDDSAAPMRGEREAAVGAVLVFRDVTEQRRAEEARARLAAIVESSEDAIVGKTLEGVIRSWNAAAERVFGYSAGEAVGQSITLIIPPERLDEERVILSQLRRGERIEHFETVRVRKDGQRIDVSLTVSPIRDETGHVIGASKIARDITARRREAAFLDGQKQVLELIARGAALPDVLAALCRLVENQSANGVLASILLVENGRLRHGAAPGLPDDYNRSINGAAIGPAVGSCGTAAFRRQPVYVSDIANDPLWENYRDLALPHGLRACWSQPILTGEGGVLGTFAMYYRAPRQPEPGDLRLVDLITRTAGIAIERARAEAERRAMEDALRETDRKKDEFIALLAHELRNPLAPLRNGVQVLRLANREADSGRRALEMMERQLGHMVRLIDDLLDVSRVSRNKMELRRCRVPLTDIVAAAVETARPLIDAGGHEMTISLPQRPIFLDADLTRLAQVFSNLLTNSAKYTPPGGRIWLSASLEDDKVTGWQGDRVTEEASHLVRISVRDNGIGIPADALPNIFDMFSQVDRSIERSTGGLGIGLALVKGLVEMHGGTVAAESRGEGQGSMFTVTLPVLADQSVPEVPAGCGEAASGPGRRVLVVDDSRDGAESLALMLRLLGNEVRTAHDGLEAVETARTFRPEVILMDVGMPRLNGLDATRRIREEPWGREVKIIALTGWGQEGDRTSSREAGCDGHLVKPVDLADLRAALSTLENEPGTTSEEGDRGHVQSTRPGSSW